MPTWSILAHVPTKNSINCSFAVERRASGSPGGGEQPFLWGGRGGAFPVGAGEIEERALGVEQWRARVHRHRVDQAEDDHVVPAVADLVHRAVEVGDRAVE